MIILEIFNFTVTGAVPFLLYASDGSAPEYCVDLILLYHVGSLMLCLLPSSLVNDLNHFGSFTTAEQICVDPVRAALVSARMNKNGGL